MVDLALILLVLLLAWSNGANDNFKGVATLYGSGTVGFRNALALASGATLLGSLVSVLFARTLARTFTGKGLVPEALIDESLLLAVGGGAMITILLATFLGLPTSTTHALTGALVGAGLVVAGPQGVSWAVLGGQFARPLLLSPFAAIGLTWAVYLALRRLRRATELEEGSCVWLGSGASALVRGSSGAAALQATSPSVDLVVEHSVEEDCRDLRQAGFVAVRPLSLMNRLHYLSGAAVCFARAVNDTPKIAALLLAAGAIGAQIPESSLYLLLVAVAMVAGGWLHARRVAETMSLRITPMNEGQGLTANLVTAFLVLVASRLGLPVSTTHVSCGSIFGIGLARGRCERGTIVKILSAWVTTLPLALVVSAVVYRVLS